MLLCFHEGKKSSAPKILFQNKINDHVRMCIYVTFNNWRPLTSLQLSQSYLKHQKNSTIPHTHTHPRNMTTHPHAEHSRHNLTRARPANHRRKPSVAVTAKRHRRCTTHTVNWGIVEAQIWTASARKLTAQRSGTGQEDRSETLSRTTCTAPPLRHRGVLSTADRCHSWARLPRADPSYPSNELRDLSKLFNLLLPWFHHPEIRHDTSHHLTGYVWKLISACKVYTEHKSHSINISYYYYYWHSQKCLLKNGAL